MERRADRLGEGFGVAGRNVVDLAVGDHDDAGEALPRHVGHRPVERGEEPGAVVAGAGLRLSGGDHANLEVAHPAEAVLERRQRRRSRLPAVADPLARRIVDDDDRDVALRRALFLDQRGVDEGRQQDRDSDRAPPQAPRPAPDAEAQDQRGGGGERGERKPRQQRREGEREGAAVHWPSRSRIAGTCTWSDL